MFPRPFLCDHDVPILDNTQRTKTCLKSAKAMLEQRPFERFSNVICSYVQIFAGLEAYLHMICVDFHEAPFTRDRLLNYKNDNQNQDLIFFFHNLEGKVYQ